MDGEGISPKLIGGCIEIMNIIFLFECEEYQRASVDYILQYVQSLSQLCLGDSKPIYDIQLGPSENHNYKITVSLSFPF